MAVTKRRLMRSPKTDCAESCAGASMSPEKRHSAITPARRKEGVALPVVRGLEVFTFGNIPQPATD
jgi:hypothetical protein